MPPPVLQAPLTFRGSGTPAPEWSAWTPLPRIVLSWIRTLPAFTVMSRMGCGCLSAVSG